MGLTSLISVGIEVVDGVLTIGSRRLDRFRILQEIGRGANGVVFSASQVHLDRLCALKIWLRLKKYDERDKLRQGFEEARKAAAAHPDWAVQIYDAEAVNGVFYCSMELVQGESLNDFSSCVEQKNSK